MNGGPSGFNNAPITRAFIIGCALFTVLFGIQGRSNKLGLSYQDIFKQLRPWKLFASIFSFSSTPELMFGLYLLYYFRVFERQIGSNKYSVFILFSIFGSLLFEVLALALLIGSSLNAISSGPYGVIFSSFVPFYLDIPVSTRFRVLGLHFSDKSFIYLAGIQLLLSSWKRSILPGICGILVGSLYRLNIFGIRRLKCPEFIASFFSRLFSSSTGSTPSAAPSRHVLGNQPPYTHLQAQSNNNYPVVPPPPPPHHVSSSTIEPPEESIATLISMGFDRNHARQALVQAGNDINTATNILLEAQIH